MATDLQAAPTTNEGSALNISEYLGIFKKRLGTIVLPTVIFFVLGGVVAKFLPQTYELATRLKIADPGVGRDITQIRVSAPPHKPMLQSVRADIVNRPFLDPIITETGLNEGFDLSSPKQRGALHEYMKKNLTVKLNPNERGPDTMEIIYIGRDRKKMVDFLNLVRERFIDNFRKEYRGGVRAIYEQLGQQQKEAEREYIELQSQFEAFQNDPDFKSVGSESIIAKNLGDTEQKKQELELDIRSLEVQERTIGDQLLGEKEETRTTSLVKNPKYEQKEQELKKATALLEDLSKKFTDQVALVQDAAKEVQRLEAELRTISKEVVGGTTIASSPVHVDLLKSKGEIKRQLDGKRRSLRDITEEIRTMQQKLDRIRKLATEKQNYQVRLDGQAKRLADLSIKYDFAQTAWLNVSGKGSDLFTILDWPNPESDPIFPNIVLFCFIGAGAGFLIGIGIAFIKEFSTLTFSSPDQVAVALPVRILGAVSHITTLEEVTEKKTKRLRFIAIAGFVIVIGAALHVAYFNKTLSKKLPSVVVKTMDKIYGGKPAKGR